MLAGAPRPGAVGIRPLELLAGARSRRARRAHPPCLRDRAGSARPRATAPRRPGCSSWKRRSATPVPGRPSATFLATAFRPGGMTQHGGKGEPRATALTSDAVGDRHRRRGPRPRSRWWRAGARSVRTGESFPGLFIDPHASFSAVWWPAWGAEMPPVRFPDRLVAIDGDPVPAEATRFELPAQPIAERLATLRARGRAEVRLTFATDQGPKTITRALRPRGADEALFYFGLYALVALFVLWSGLAVLVLARRRAGAVAYAAWSVGTFVFMVTFYDYHSAAWLAPLFSLSTMSFPVCVVWLAYSFPEPPRVAPPRAARGRHRVHGVRRGRRRGARARAVPLLSPAPGSAPAARRRVPRRALQPAGAVDQHPVSAARRARPPSPGAAVVGAGAGGGSRVDRARVPDGVRRPARRSSTSCSRSWCR